MEDNSLNHSNPDHRSRLIEAIKSRLIEELKNDHFLNRLFEKKYFINDLSPEQVPDLPYSELNFDNFHVHCVNEICIMENLKWTLPGKLLVHNSGNENSVHFNSGGELVGFINKIEYENDSAQDSNKRSVNILKFEISKPIPMVVG